MYLLHKDTENRDSDLRGDSFIDRAPLDSLDRTKEYPFGVDTFKAMAAMAVEKLAYYLADNSMRGLTLNNPSHLLETARSLTHDASATDREKLAAIVDLYIDSGIQLYSPGSMGRQFSGVFPLAGIVDLVSAIANQPSSFYEAGQLPNVAERIMAEELNTFIGWPAGRYAMVTTSGGSLANLTAILAARNDKFPQVWSIGLAAGATACRPAIAVSEDAHYSICRAAGVLGIGEDQIVRLPINAQRQIDVEKVRPLLDAAAASGLGVFCLVASAGTTSVGAFDPLDGLSDIAAERDIWLHVDGAHGASLLVSDALRERLRGIARVDSFSWDAHKMMFMPPACTLLFYKHKEKADGAFRQEASYVFEAAEDIYTAYDSAAKNLECTKRPMIMNLWILWALYGRKPFAEKIEYLCRLTQHVHRMLLSEGDFEALHEPQSNILCFRYRPSFLPPGQLGPFQLTIRNRVRARGRFFISKVDIDGIPALRVVFMNHRITAAHFAMLLDEVRAIGRDILAEEFGASPAEKKTCLRQ